MEELIRIFPLHLHEFCRQAFGRKYRPEEIRIRVRQPLQLLNSGEELFWNGECLQEASKGAYRASETDVQEILDAISRYSLYAFEEELRSGFLTIQGGHRVGLAGKAVCEGGQICTLRQISFLNIRIAGERKGCADSVLPYLREGERIYNTLIVSPPGVGKTTLLRDCIRQISDGDDAHLGKRVGLVDERSELAASYMGCPQKDVGLRTDVLDCCPKSQGMLLLLRSMSPQVIGVDELGGAADYEAVEYVLHCGCRILGTLHGESLMEMEQKPYLAKWLREGYFERLLFLERGQGQRRRFHIYNERREQLC
ncbi:MAG: stage III sporulation protein AA [Lachnospiraceae bacterium]|nr:stage III sporulation protein AA [Lachnospiraceae bacterium]